MSTYMLNPLLPALATLKVNEVLRKDIANQHHRHCATPTQANRMLTVLSKLFTLEELWHLRPDVSTHCRHVLNCKKNEHQRYLV